MIREYSNKDKPKVIELLRKNTPEYFDASEENDFEKYLENEVEDYYVTQIANAVRELDNNKYPLSHYMAYGWDGLTKYGYTAKRLTIAENTNNQNLRSIVNQNSQICK